MVGWQQFGRRGPSLEFAPLRDAGDWSFAMAGQVTQAAGTDFLTIGLQSGPDPLPVSRLEDVVHRDATGTGVPVAVFSDFFCPYCRGLIGRLKARDAQPSIDITWHELPLLGDNSVLVAQAAEAAALQEGYVPFYNQLLADGFRPAPRWMAQIAERAGLDAARLTEDMTGPEVAARLADTAAAAKRLGIFATPGIAIGKRVILGALDKDLMEEIIADVAR
jgi:protein-disulfide isomerase